MRRGQENATVRLVEGVAPHSHAHVRGVTKVFPSVGRNPPVHALGPIDLEFERGRVVSVIGPSGCGKSTLLDLLAGLSTPSEGMVEFEGRAVGNRTPEGVGVVFQEDSSYPWLTIWDNVAFGLRRQGRLSKTEIREKVDRIIAFMGLSSFARAYPAQLSGGMRQRVCIARTLVLEPRLLLLDEPFGALDEQTRLLMGDELLRIWRETDATVMLITHSLDEAAMLSDRVAVMSARPGRFIEVIETGWPRERTSMIRSNPHHGALTARMWELLRDESLKAMKTE